MSWTAVHYAARDGDADRIRDMIRDGGVDMYSREATGKTALMLAAKWGRDEVCEVLLRLGCSVNDVDKSGRSALDYATKPTVIKLLKELPVELDESKYIQAMAEAKRLAREKKIRETKEKIEESQKAKNAVLNQSKLAEMRRLEEVENKRRICRKCGSSFKKAKNRAGECAHGGVWTLGAKDDEGIERDYLRHWNCCESKIYNSKCPRSDAHEEA